MRSMQQLSPEAAEISKLIGWNLRDQKPNTLLIVKRNISETAHDELRDEADSHKRYAFEGPTNVNTNLELANWQRPEVMCTTNEESIRLVGGKARNTGRKVILVE